jgi:hypothetical protein
MRAAMTEREKPSEKESAARFAAIGGLVFILITACASAVSMLIWGQ